MRTSVTKRNLRGNGHASHASDWLRVKNIQGGAADLKRIAETMLRDSAYGVKMGSKRLHHRIGAYTAKQPLKTIGFALATGAVIGWLFRR